MASYQYRELLSSFQLGYEKAMKIISNYSGNLADIEPSYLKEVSKRWCEYTLEQFQTMLATFPQVTPKNLFYTSCQTNLDIAKYILTIQPLYPDNEKDQWIIQPAIEIAHGHSPEMIEWILSVFPEVEYCMYEAHMFSFSTIRTMAWWHTHHPDERKVNENSVMVVLGSDLPTMEYFFHLYGDSFNLATSLFHISALLDSKDPVSMINYLKTNYPEIVKPHVPEIIRYAEMHSNYEVIKMLTEETAREFVIEKIYKYSDLEVYGIKLNEKQQITVLQQLLRCNDPESVRLFLKEYPEVDVNQNHNHEFLFAFNYPGAEFAAVIQRSIPEEEVTLHCIPDQGGYLTTPKSLDYADRYWYCETFTAYRRHFFFLEPIIDRKYPEDDSPKTSYIKMIRDHYRGAGF